ncbi:MAG TPA: hypothetical protein VFH17_00725, partial [Coriobacteriia bacterium]|nr:hypothetical protein [Coriobacteriia bacterium]
MSSRHRATGRFSPALVPSGRMIVLLAAVLCAILTAACSPGRIEPDSRPSRENGGRSEVSLASLEGLAFVRDGSVWTVSDGEARRVVESNGIRSLRANRTGDSVTWIETDGTRAIVMAALTSDWKPEPVWESDLGSLISEAVHDDVTDTVWFSVSGEATTTIGVVERLTRAAPREVRLPVEVATAIALAPADGALFV